MGAFWGPVDKANLERVGPFADAVAGTDGEDTDVNALVSGGANRIIIGPGSILTANLNLSSASGGYLWSPGHPRALNLGAFQITLATTAASWHLEGFELSGSSTVGLLITGSAEAISMHRLSMKGHATHGIQGNGGANDMSVVDCLLWNNTNDGFKIGSGHANCRVWGNFIWNNSGNGVNDLSNSAILVGNRLNGNGTAISGSPAINVGNLI